MKAGAASTRPSHFQGYWLYHLNQEFNNSFFSNNGLRNIFLAVSHISSIKHKMEGTYRWKNIKWKGGGGGGATVKAMALSV